MNDLQCMNCSQPVPSTDAKIFAGCFVCGGCHAIASAAQERVQRQLQQLQVLVLEGIRLAIIQKKLTRPAEDSEVAPGEAQRRVLTKIVEMVTDDGPKR